MKSIKQMICACFLLALAFVSSLLITATPASAESDEAGYWKPCTYHFEMHDLAGRRIAPPACSLEIKMMPTNGSFADGSSKVKLHDGLTFNIKDNKCAPVNIKIKDGTAEATLYAPKSDKAKVTYTLKFICSDKDVANESFRGDKLSGAKEYRATSQEITLSKSSQKSENYKLYLDRQHRSLSEYLAPVLIFVIFLLVMWSTTNNLTYNGLLTGRGYDHSKANLIKNIHFFAVMFVCFIAVAIGFFWPGVEVPGHFPYYSLCISYGVAMLVLIGYIFYARSLSSQNSSY